MHVRVVAHSIELFGLSANVQSLCIDHVDVKQECQIVVSIWVSVIHKNALLQMLNSMLIITDLKVSQAQVIL